jgi:uncharacterized protein
MTGVYLLSMVFVVLSMLVSGRLKSKFAAYSRVPLQVGLTGREVAERMLKQHGIYDVQVISVAGELTDHYNPIHKTVNLSAEVYETASVAAAAVAAHECGHAVQHATAYPWLGMRSKLVPAVQFSSQILQWVLLGGIIMVGVFPQLLMAGIALFALTTVFSLITLPVEFDASRKALGWLKQAGLVQAQEHIQAKDALHWAAMTYVVAAVASVATLLQYLFILLSNTRQDRD